MVTEINPIYKGNYLFGIEYWEGRQKHFQRTEYLSRVSFTPRQRRYIDQLIAGKKPEDIPSAFNMNRTTQQVIRWVDRFHLFRKWYNSLTVRDRYIVYDISFQDWRITLKDAKKLCPRIKNWTDKEFQQSLEDLRESILEDFKYKYTQGAPFGANKHAEKRKISKFVQIEEVKRIGNHITICKNKQIEGIISQYADLVNAIMIAYDKASGNRSFTKALSDEYYHTTKKHIQEIQARADKLMLDTQTAINQAITYLDWQSKNLEKHYKIQLTYRTL